MKIQSKVVMALVALPLWLPTIAWSSQIATVNGKPVTDQDLKNALASFNEGQRHSLLKDINTRRQILNSVIDEELLEQEAKNQELDQSPEYKAALDGFRKRYLANAVVTKNVSNKLSDSAVKRYYEANKEHYSTEQVHAQHILVSDAEKAQEVMKEAKAPNADFQALAEKISKDPSAKNNRGDLGFFGRGQMVPEFTNAAFGAKAGEIIGPVKTSYGYHIIKVLEHKPGKVLEFSDVEGRVRNELQGQEMRKYMENLRKEAKVSIDDKALQKM